VDLVSATQSVSRFAVKLRYLRDQTVSGQPKRAGEEVQSGASPIQIDVPVRRANRRVIHVGRLKDNLRDALVARGVDLGDGQFGAGEFAIQMLQFPYRQRFEGDGAPPPGSTRPHLTATTIYATATFAINVVAAPLTEVELTTLFPKLGVKG
jgi:hypothetical protein